MSKFVKIAAALMVLLGASHAYAEPISTFLGSALFTVGGVSVSVGAAIAAGVSIASSWYAGRQQKKAARRALQQQWAQDAASLQDRTATLVQGDAARMVIYGEPAPVGGVPVAQLSAGLAAEYKFIVFVLASHPCEAVEQVYIDGTPLNIDADGWTTNSEFLIPPQYIGDASAGPAVRVKVHLSPGGVDTADPDLISAMETSWPGRSLWTADHKLSGCTYLVIMLNQFFERFQGGMPQFTAKVKGKNTIYDPRTGAVGYTRNNALILADFLRSREGFSANQNQIETASLIAAANACDMQVYGAGALTDYENYGKSRAMYVCDGMFRTDQDREMTRRQIEESMGGFSLESAGVWRIQAGTWATPVMNLGDVDMVKPVVVTQAANSSAARLNGIRGTYINQARAGVTDDFVPYFNGTFLELDGREMATDVALPFTASHVRCHQLARVRVERSRGGMIVRLQPKLKAWKLQPGDRVTLSSAFHGFSNKTFVITDWSYSADAPLTILAEEDVASFYDLTDEVKADPAPNTNLPNPFAAVEPPSGLDVVSEEVQQSGTLIYRARVFWDPSTDAAVLLNGAVRVEWRRNLPNAPWQTTELPGDATQTYLTALEVGAEYEVRVRFQSRWTVSSYTRVYYVFTGKSRAPEDVAELTVTVEADGVYVRWASPEGLDLLDWSVSEVRVGPTWDAGAVLWRGKSTVANIGWLIAGSRAVWVAHRDREGRESIPQFEIVEILPPAQPLPEASVANRNIIHIAWQDCKTTQPLRAYEVRYGQVFSDAPVVGLSGSTIYTSEQLKFGNHRYWLVAVDVAGNRSAAGYADATTLESYDAPIRDLRGYVRNAMDLIAEIEANNALNADDQSQRVRAGAYERIEVVKEENKALVTRFTALSATVDQNQAIISSQLQVVATNLYAEARRIDIVAAVSNDNAAAIVQEQVARADGDSALASMVTTVQSLVGDLSATVDIQANTIANLNGNVAAQYMVRTEVIGVTGKRAMAGLLLGVSSGSGGTDVQSEAIVFADRFIVSPNTSTLGDAPFRVEGGVVYMNTAKIKDADIGTLKLAGRAVTQPAYAETEATVSLPNSGFTNSLFIYGFDAGGEFVKVSSSFDADADLVQVAILRNGVLVAARTVRSGFEFGFTPPAGSADYGIFFTDASGGGGGYTRFKSVSFLGCKR